MHFIIKKQKRKKISVKYDGSTMHVLRGTTNFFNKNLTMEIIPVFYPVVGNIIFAKLKCLYEIHSIKYCQNLDTLSERF